MYNEGTVTLSRSTIAGSVASRDGGGVYNEQALTVTHSTVSRNTAAFEGGGLFLAADAEFNSSIVAANLAGASGPDCAGAATSNGYNLIGDTDGFFCAFAPSTGDQVGSGGGLTDAMLAVLASNAGPTQTIAVAPSSPAVVAVPVGARAIDGSTPLCPATGSRDQRGVFQPQGAGCDIGAFEVTTPR